LQDADYEHPGVILASEGADFLEGQIERVEEFFRRQGLRQLQRVHYRVNELGDIQTAPPKHGGLTPFGEDVIKQCNELGLVVDVAHGTFDLVKRAAEVCKSPLLLSHTSLSLNPPPFSRLISPDHARVIAKTGGVIGIWPPTSIFPDLRALAEGMARMVEVVGVDHVGLGTDMLGLTTTSALKSYGDLPQLADAMLLTGFSAQEVGKILGGNYIRLFLASIQTAFY
jgi:membrane dipeptidase